jgi:hypothetical protein
MAVRRINTVMKGKDLIVDVDDPDLYFRPDVTGG